ncbi:lateral signaling target protein 2 homolog [Topomyia yanbarensis]|uniref:lateral signaling target protein 2 homolog n=1 Tax=Topomyia yanbarensis TaxID=2498891 RepID=UPI00273CD9E7|nr:lateral signaling target protein 2 homolog [Topomyia yanbarensis]
MVFKSKVTSVEDRTKETNRKTTNRSSSRLYQCTTDSWTPSDGFGTRGNIPGTGCSQTHCQSQELHHHHRHHHHYHRQCAPFRLIFRQHFHQ